MGEESVDRLMPSPFDKVLTNANVIDSQGNVTSQEKEKFINRVESILRAGSSVPGLEFPPDPFANETAKRLRESDVWEKTYVEGLFSPTMKSLDTKGNVPLFPVHDLSSTFNINIDINDLKDPTKFTPDELALKSGLTVPKVSDKLLDITANVPAIPPTPSLPELPTPDGLLGKFNIEKSTLGVGADINVNTRIVTVQPLSFFEKLLQAPVTTFKDLLLDPTGTLDAAINLTLPQKILGILLGIVKLAIAAVAAIISVAYVLVATILAWVYSIVSAIAASAVSVIIGTGSISTSVYNAQISS